MKNDRWFASAGAPARRRGSRLALGAAALGISTATLAGCAGDKCDSSDLDCFLQHMVLVEPKEGASPMTLVDVPRPSLTPTSCGATICGATCTNLGFDPKNCGGCGLACPSGATCAAGQCTCPSGAIACGGKCTNLQSDPDNCNVCGNACGAGAHCSSGECVPSCSGSFSSCGGACVDTQIDAQNCGGCGAACGPGQTCQGGACQCTSPLYACGCIDPSTDPQNCGGCGIACDPGTPCTGGACTSGAASNPPSITSPPAGMSFDDPSELQPLDLSFDDPNECTPAFCTHLCSNGRCSSGFLCTRPKRDHQIQGVFRSYLGFLAEPAEETTTFTTGVVPISAPGCPDDLLDKLAAGDDVAVAVGVEVAIEVSIEYTEGSGGSGGGPDAQCTGQTPMCSCSVEACATSSGQCWYETSAGRFDCGANCDCYAAAQAAVQACCPTP